MNTKKAFKYILIGMTVLMSTASCTDHLNTPPNDKLSPEGFYESPVQSEQGVLGVYGGMRYAPDFGYLYLSECRSDNAWVEPRTDGLREYSEIGTFRAGNDIASMNTAWDTWFKVIYDANVAIKRMPGCNFETAPALKDQLWGEVHFLRALAYFELVRLFGNIPMVNEPLLPVEVLEIPQSPAREVYDKMIIPDLKIAKEKLPLAKNMMSAFGKSLEKDGRADQIAAQALLGRVYMTMAGFPLNDASTKSLAEAELKSVIDFSDNNGKKYWAPDSSEWRKQFMPTAEYYNKYPIFSIQYRTGGFGNPAIFNYSPALPKTYTGRKIFGNSIFVEKTLMHEFDKTYKKGENVYMDARGHNYSILTGFAAEPNFPAYSQTTEKLKLEDGSEVDVFTRTMFYKFTPTIRKIAALGMGFDAELGMKDDYDWPVNYPIIRLEDVQLMYAEILAERGDVAGALQFVNRIRERSGCEPAQATSPTEAMKMVKRERRIELMGEGVRWFDIVRWGEWKETISNMFDRYNNPIGIDKANLRDGRHLYPIPLYQMNVKPGLYNQNTGY